jgi:asparagine N-glycosylation enzyme membrane subunit Stt3
LLLVAFAVAFLVRTLFAIGVFSEWGWLYVFGGGSDSFYHWRVTEYILINHTNLIRDPLLKYPLGAINPREPVFDWMNAILGLALAPFFHGNAVTAAAFALDVDAPFWSALTVVPIYLIGKEVSSRRMGLIAAFTYPFIVGSLQSAVLGYANYLSFYTFFILVYLYAVLKTVKTVSTRTYVPTFRDPHVVARGLRDFLQAEPMAVKWAVFGGVALGALALIWQGYPLAIAIVVIFLVVIMIVERIRRIDSFGLYVTTWIAGLIGFPMATPYYLVQGLFPTWFDLPLLLYFGPLLLLLPFVLLRQYPWVVTVPLLGLLAAGGLGALYAVNRTFFANLVTGQGYFAKTLIYSTVAEAQAPSIDSLILSYGVLTFFLAFVGLALFLINLARKRFRREHTFFVVFAIVSIFLPVSASKFFYVGSPAFALLPAEAILLILNVAGYPQLRRTAASLAGVRGQFTAVRRSFKARHVLVMLLVAVLLIPNVWYSIDAGIPYNSKTGYGTQVFDTIPPFLRANSSSYYVGASGVQLDTPNQYDEAGYDWLALQDANVPVSARPAFISWWDYGFQAATEGQHPTVADNFQNGIDPAGNFLLSQNESQAIAILAITLLQGVQASSHEPYFPPALNAILARDGVNVAELHTLMVNTSADVPLVIAHPDRYLPVDAAHLDPTNAMFMATAWFLATSLTEAQIVQVYDDIQSFSGTSIRYAMVDSRLFPFPGQPPNTGIFYAPADLTDRIIGPGGIPTTYFTVTVTGSDGATYPLGQVPPGVTPTSYSLNYNPAFYQTMLYHIFVGYNGTDIGQSSGVPGVTIAGYPQPGWMLQHFRVVYRTAYYCPTPSSVSNPSCPKATDNFTATALAARTNGTADTSSSAYYGSGEAILEYYPGQTLTGQVELPNGAPVVGARVTVYDEWGIPHMTDVTGRSGAYSVILPPGNDTVNVTAGPMNGLKQAGRSLLASIKLPVPDGVALSTDAPIQVRPIVLRPSTVAGLVYWNVGSTGSFDPATDPVVPGATVTLGGNSSANYTAVADPEGGYRFTNIAPGNYNLTVQYRGVSYTAVSNLAVLPGTTLSQDAPLTPASVNGTVEYLDHTPAAGAAVTVTSASGVVSSTTADSRGVYQIHDLVPGNYTLQAQAGSSEASNSTFVSLASEGARQTLNLTVYPAATVDFTVAYQGLPVPSFPVRFTPILSSPPIDNPALTRPNAQAGIVFRSDSSGFVSATVPIGNYSVYGLGAVGSQFVAGFENAYLFAGGGGTYSLGTLVVSPAVTIHGSSPLPTGTPATAVGAREIIAYSASGDQAQTFADASGTWTLQIPAGTYSLQALAYGFNTSTGDFSAVSTVSLTTSQSLSLPLQRALNFAPTVGAMVRSGTQFYPAGGAIVELTLSDSGATIAGLSSPTGNVSLLVPSTDPSATYCVGATAAGFGSYHVCGLTGGALTSLHRIVLPLYNVTVSVTVPGLASGGLFHLNATALRLPGSNATAAGGSNFTVSLAPGAYQMTGWATSTSGLYLPVQPVNFTIQPGLTPGPLTIPVYHQVKSRGSLSLPAGVTTAGVSIRIMGSPVNNLTVNGTTYEAGFFLPVGSYSAYATGGSYVNVTRISVGLSGTISPGLYFQGSASLSGRLVAVGGGTVNATVPILFAGSDGSLVYALATDGNYSLTLPAQSRFYPYVNTSLTTTTRGLVRFATYSSVAGASCAVGTTATTCDIPLQISFAMSGFSASLTYRGSPLNLPATLRLMGPLPSTQITTLSTSNGAFSASVLPGEYVVDADTASAGVLLANVSTLVVPYPNPTSVAIGVSSAWTDSLTLLPPANTYPGAANVTWTSPTGVNFTFSGMPFGTPSSFLLPTGPWQLRANTTVQGLDGAPTPAVVNATVNLLAGNLATELTLVPEVVRSVSFSAVSPTAVALPAVGGTASFAFFVHDSGNVPVTASFTGDPTAWGFSFSPSYVTLQPGPLSPSARVQVTVSVPSGTAVNHPAAAFNAVLLANTSQVLGSTSPGPVVTIAPAYGLALLHSTSAPTVTALNATLPFSIDNVGNVGESVAVAVSDTTGLEAMGWHVALVTFAGAPVTRPVSVGAGTSTALQVRLTTPAFAVSPGNVLITAAVTNDSTIVRSLELPVPTTPVSFTAPTVSGPGVGPVPLIPTEYYVLLALIPAGAFLAVMFTYRWWRRRRWVRR